MQKSSPNLEVKVIIVGALAISILASLGLWQLERAEEKQQLLELQAQNNEPIKYLSNAKPQHLDRVALPGTFLDNSVFLLDNRIHQGKAGYEILALLQQDMDKRVTLVNLGWVAGSKDRQQLPSIALPSTDIVIKGRLTQISDNFVLGEDHWQDGWPKRIQQIDLEKMESVLGMQLHPWQIRLDAPLLEGLVVDWKVINMTPQKHQGYAVQWFGLAVALLIWLVWFLRSRYKAST